MSVVDARVDAERFRQAFSGQVQAGVYVRLGRLEHPRDVARREPLAKTQEEHLALSPGQSVDGLAGPGVEFAGEGPIDGRRRVGSLLAVQRRGVASASASISVDVQHDPQHPGAEGGVAPVAPPSSEHEANRLLDHLLGRVRVARQAQREPQGGRQMVDHQTIHRGSVAGSCHPPSSLPDPLS